MEITDPRTSATAVPDAAEEKRAASARIARDIEAFERSGGQIERLHPAAVSGIDPSRISLREQHIAAATRGRAARAKSAARKIGARWRRFNEPCQQKRGGLPPRRFLFERTSPQE